MKLDGINISSASVDNQFKAKAQTSDEKAIQQTALQIKASQENYRNSKYTKEEMTISEKTIIDAIEKANKAIEGPNKRFEFSIHKGTREIMVKVFDNDTGEVIRELPPEKILDMVAKMWEMAGIIVDERR